MSTVDYAADREFNSVGWDAIRDHDRRHFVFYSSSIFGAVASSAFPSVCCHCEVMNFNGMIIIYEYVGGVSY